MTIIVMAIAVFSIVIGNLVLILMMTHNVY